MALSEMEKTDVRRYCGYPIWGSAQVVLMAAATYQSRGLLEYRMNNLTTSEETILRRHIGTLIMLESAIPRTAENLDTDQAAIWTRNRTEPADRLNLLDTWCRRVCHFLGVSPGPGLAMGNRISVVV
jgi:hypothetical protein